MERSTCRRSRAGRVESDVLEVDGKIRTGQSRLAENLSWVAEDGCPRPVPHLLPRQKWGGGRQPAGVIGQLERSFKNLR